MNTKVLAVASLSAAIAFTAAAQSQIQTQLSDPFASALSAITAGNTQLRAAALRNQADASDAAAANTLAPTEVGVDHVWGSGGIGTKTSVSVTQPFDWPGLYRARSSAARAAAAAAKEQETALMSDIRLEAKLKLMELVHLRRQLALMRTLKANADSLQSYIERGYRGGELTILDTKKIAVEQYRINTEIATLSAAVDDACASLQAMCPGQPLNLDNITEYPAEPRLSASEYTSRATTHNSAARAAALAADAEALNAKAASRSRLPGFSLGYQFLRELGDYFNGFSVGITLPALQNHKASAAAKARAAVAVVESEHAKADAQMDTKAACAQLELWAGQIEAYQRAFGDDAYLTLLCKAYRGGQISVIDYITEVSYYTEANRVCLECEYNYFTTLARLNRNAGMDLIAN